MTYSCFLGGGEGSDSGGSPFVESINVKIVLKKTFVFFNIFIFFIQVCFFIKIVKITCIKYQNKISIIFNEFFTYGVVP